MVPETVEIGMNRSASVAVFLVEKCGDLPNEALQVTVEWGTLQPGFSVVGDTVAPLAPQVCPGGPAQEVRFSITVTAGSAVKAGRYDLRGIFVIESARPSSGGSFEWMAPIDVKVDNGTATPDDGNTPSRSTPAVPSSVIGLLLAVAAASTPPARRKFLSSVRRQ